MAAGMDSFVGEVAIIPFSLIPRNWLLCSGQLLSISANAALFSLLGTSYGGNGTSTFALPNLTEHVVVGAGYASYGITYIQGQTGGSYTTLLGTANMPTHQHIGTTSLGMLVGGTANSNSPVGNYPAQTGIEMYSTTANATTNMPMDAANIAVGTSGTGQPYVNLQSYTGINFIIATAGIFPPRS